MPLPHVRVFMRHWLIRRHFEIDFASGFAMPADAQNNRFSGEPTLAHPHGVASRVESSFVGWAALTREPILGAFDVEQPFGHIADLEAADFFAAGFGMDPDQDLFAQAVGRATAIVGFDLEIERHVPQSVEGRPLLLFFRDSAQDAQVTMQTSQVLIAGWVPDRRAVGFEPRVPLAAKESRVRLNL